MSINVKIQDGKGSKRTAGVDEEGAILFTERLTPPYGADTINIALTQFITDDGADDGVSDMRVNGSVTAQEFFIEAHPVNDRYISNLTIAIADAGAALDEFGRIGDLTNGVLLSYMHDFGTVIFGNIQTNSDMLELCGFNKAWGNSTSAFLLNNFVGTTDAYINTIDFKERFGFRFGIRLKGGSKQRLSVTIRDDVTGVDRFDMKIFGFDRLPDDQSRIVA